VPGLEKFAYVGVYSSGLLGAFPELAGRGGRGGRGAAGGAPGTPPPPPPLTADEWSKEHAAKLGDASLKKGLKLLWFATGKDDFLLEQTKATVELFKKHGFAPVYKETDGGHTWINWRIYLAEFAPMLFQ
jgi:enterochelin esterase family protein